MIIRVQPYQVPQLWEYIKFASIKSDLVEEDYLQRYCNDLLVGLLTSKKHVMVMFGEDRMIQLLMILSFGLNKLSGKKTLYMDNLYGWKKTELKEKQDFFMSVKQFAKSTDCDYIEARTYNPKMISFAESLQPLREQRQYLFTV